jgi:hypothetical protein
MYDGFSDFGKHSTEWVWITKVFLKFAFASGHREASCPCSRCENYRSKLPQGPWAAGYGPNSWTQPISYSGIQQGGHTPRTRGDPTSIKLKTHAHKPKMN